MSSEMEVSVHTEVWDSVRELTKLAQRKGSDPLLWALQISSNLNSAGVALPSVELADVLVSYICWENNLPSLWKFLEKALILKIVPPMFVLALLSTRVIPCRHSRPAAYRLYLELLKRHAFTLKYQINGLNYQNFPHEEYKNLVEVLKRVSLGNTWSLLDLARLANITTLPKMAEARKQRCQILCATVGQYFQQYLPLATSHSISAVYVLTVLAVVTN